jgi:hypothetical protein
MKTIYNILIEFNSKEEGLEYMQTSKYPFSFTDSLNIYNPEGDTIPPPENVSIYKPSEIFIGFEDIDAPGMLYVEDGFLRYYKESYTEI